MSDDFYAPFDHVCLTDAFNPERRTDYRGVFQQDLGRLMFTGAFRRLQAKTQVFQAGEYDFYRTRLTHSLDVAHIAKSIAVWLRSRYGEVRVDSDLLEAICLAHDIGHPPFGHAGEKVLNELMAPFGGFEGNAQTLRILTRTIYTRGSGRGGMTPTRALLDGVLKYKRLHRDRGTDTNHFIYDDQSAVLEFCFGTGDLAASLGTPEVNRFRSLECQIMDLADDMAYSCFDLVDGAKARFISPDRVGAWGERNRDRLDPAQIRHLEELPGMIATNKLQPMMNQVIGELIQSADVAPADNFMASRTRRHAFGLVCPPAARRRISLHKELCRDLIFQSSAVQQIEFKGRHILRTLTQSLMGNYLDSSDKPLMLVPTEVHRALVGAGDKASAARLLCDHISGMTDAYALRSYKRLLDPDYGSISELI